MRRVPAGPVPTTGSAAEQMGVWIQRLHATVLASDEPGTAPMMAGVLDRLPPEVRSHQEARSLATTVSAKVGEKVAVRRFVRYKLGEELD